MRIQTVVEREDLTDVVHKRIMRQVMEATGQRHVTRRVGKHFQRNRETTPGGAYGYARRSKRTKAVKRRRGGDPNRPNYRTGEMMRHVQNNSKLTRTRDRWTWTARSPFALNLQRRLELEAISRDEIASDTKFMETEYVRLARLPGNVRKRKRKVG